MAVEADFHIGCTLKDKLIPFSYLWYTGEAAMYDDEYDPYDEEGLDDDEDLDDDEGEGRGG